MSNWVKLTKLFLHFSFCGSSAVAASALPLVPVVALDADVVMLVATDATAETPAAAVQGRRGRGPLADSAAATSEIHY